MANMSYCRFRNTLTDFRDCCDTLRALMDGEEDADRISGEELEAAQRLLAEAIQIVTETAEHVGKPVEELDEDDAESMLKELSGQ